MVYYVPGSLLLRSPLNAVFDVFPAGFHNPGKVAKLPAKKVGDHFVEGDDDEAVDGDHGGHHYGGVEVGQRHDAGVMAAVQLAVGVGAGHAVQVDPPEHHTEAQAHHQLSYGPGKQVHPHSVAAPAIMSHTFGYVLCAKY